MIKLKIWMRLTEAITSTSPFSFQIQVQPFVNKPYEIISHYNMAVQA